MSVANERELTLLTSQEVDSSELRSKQWTGRKVIVVAMLSTLTGINLFLAGMSAGGKGSDLATVLYTSAGTACLVANGILSCIPIPISRD